MIYTQEEIDKSVEIMDHVTTLALLEFNRLYPHYNNPSISNISHAKNVFSVMVKTYAWGESAETEITILDSIACLSIEEYQANIEEMIFRQKEEEEARRKLKIIEQEKIKAQREKRRLIDEKLLYEKLKAKYEK